MFALILAAVVAQATPSPSPSPAATATPAASATPAATATPSASPAPPLFVAPKGWKAQTPPSLGANPTYTSFIAAYSDNAGDKFLVIRSRSNGLSLADTAEMNANAFKAQGIKVATSGPTTLCGQPAWHYTLENVRGMRAEATLAANATNSYIAMYSYHTSPIRAGHDAVMSVCLPRDGAAISVGAPPMSPPQSWTPLNLSALMARLPENQSAWGWHGPILGDHADIIMVLSFATPVASDFDTFRKGLERGMGTWATDLTLQSHEETPLCDGSKGQHLLYTAIVAHRDMILDVVTSVQTPRSLLAAYMRQSKDKEDPEAVRAIKTLCPQGGQQLGYAPVGS